ncbi:hypothetical protein MPSEU_000389100 [Mayamaea pseudoterrestris]|nr:hypothetical protein MPSEU_000389100 [Mayamaea pseudoterrestris]
MYAGRELHQSMQSDSTNASSLRQPFSTGGSSCPAPAAPPSTDHFHHEQTAASSYSGSQSSVRIAPPTRGPCLTIVPPATQHLRPILPAPTSSCTLPMAAAAGSMPFLPSSASILPVCAQNPLGLLLAKLNGGVATTANRFAVHPLFHGRKQRSGKWIPEEEEYAEILIQLFEKGYLFDCENGSTLRSYLSRKLHCAPMRISKKYAGKGIGKMLFICRIRLNMSVLAPSPEEIKILERKANEKELLFYRAVFPEKMLPDPRDILAANSDGDSSNFAAMPMTTILVPVQVSANAHTPMSMAYMTPAGSQALVQGYIPTAENEATRLMPPPASVGSTTMLTAALQRSFYNAMQQQQQIAVPGEPVVAREAISTTVQRPQGINQQLAAQAMQPEAIPSIPTSVNVPGTHVYRPRSVPPPVLPASGHGIALSPVWISTASPQANATMVNSRHVNTNTLSPVPDFLAGFDKVKLAMRPKRLQNGNGGARDEESQQYSPPFTSRSFDDFHRFLGEDLAPLGSPVVHSTQPSARSAGPFHNFDPDTIFGLEPVSQIPQRADYVRPGGRSAQAREDVHACSQNLNEHSAFEHDETVFIHNNMNIHGTHYSAMNVGFNGEFSAAAAVSDNNDSGRSSVDRSRSEQDNATASSGDSLEDSDDPDWDDCRIFNKRKAAAISK